MPSPILARADALMQRRHQSLADTEDVPVLTDSVAANGEEADDDVPVLMDAEAMPLMAEKTREECSPQKIESPENIPVPPPALDTALRDIIAHELARRVEQRLAEELPRIIESTVRDFLAEQENIAALQPRD